MAASERGTPPLHILNPQKGRAYCGLSGGGAHTSRDTHTPARLCLLCMRAAYPKPPGKYHIARPGNTRTYCGRLVEAVHVSHTRQAHMCLRCAERAFPLKFMKRRYRNRPRG
jgi:hypothetical protein